MTIFGQQLDDIFDEILLYVYIYMYIRSWVCRPSREALEASLARLWKILVNVFDDMYDRFFLYMHIWALKEPWLVRSLSYDLGNTSRASRESLESSLNCLWRILVNILMMFFDIFCYIYIYVYIHVFVVQGRKLVRSLSYDLRSPSRGSRESLEVSLSCLWRF